MRPNKCDKKCSSALLHTCNKASDALNKTERLYSFRFAFPIYEKVQQ